MALFSYIGRGALWMWGIMRAFRCIRAICAVGLVGLVGCGGTIGDPDVDIDAGLVGLDASRIDDPMADAAPMLVPATCDDGDVRVSDPITGNCYLRFNENVTWQVASARCQAAGAHLVSIETVEEDALVASIAPQNANDPTDFDGWIGANDIANETTWMWETTLEPFVFTNWRSGEPNNNNDDDPTGEDCAVYEGDTSTWDDRTCSMLAIGYYCEREATFQ